MPHFHLSERAAVLQYKTTLVYCQLHQILGRWLPDPLDEVLRTRTVKTLWVFLCLISFVTWLK
jgi:hypothetical protein